MAQLADFASSNRVEGAELSGIGAFERAVVGFYNLERQEYEHIPVEEETEVLSVLGNLSLTDEGPRVHLHATLSRRDGSALGGHLFEGVVAATLEVFVHQTATPLRRVPDPAAGIPLLDL